MKIIKIIRRLFCNHIWDNYSPQKKRCYVCGVKKLRKKVDKNSR